MGFNYASEKLRFDAEWRELAAQYKNAGMDEAGIKAMRDFDWKLFCNRRTYENRNQTLPSEIIDDSDDGSNSALFKKYPSLAVRFDESSFLSRYAWIDDVTDPVLSDKLYALTDEDKELLTLYIFDGYTQEEIAVMWGCSKVAICKKIRRIKIFLK